MTVVLGGIMLKGVNRRVVVVKAERGSPFEAVYMVLKQGSRATEGDILKEADRIASQGLSADSRRDGGRMLPHWAVFVSGALSGAATVGVVMLVLLLLS